LLLNISQKQEILENLLVYRSSVPTHVLLQNTHYEVTYAVFVSSSRWCVWAVSSFGSINQLLWNLCKRYANLILLAIRADVIPCTKMKACTT